MDYCKIIKEIGWGKNYVCDLDLDIVYGLYIWMLNGEVFDLEMGSILMVLCIKGEGEVEMLGFYEVM